MKAKNINVGEYIARKTNGQLVKVASAIPLVENPKIYADNWRRPRISDLKPDDVFEMYGESWFVTTVQSDRIYAATDTERGRVSNDFPLETPVRIISLAEGKPKPKTGTVEQWVNVYQGGITGYNTKESADILAGEERIACIKLTGTWTEGEGL